MIFKSDLTPYTKLNEEFVNSIKISQLPQLYRADMTFALAQGNPQLNEMLKHFKPSGKFKYISIDSRSHMLMKGIYPCIPGWHCDDFYRPPHANGQPDLTNVEEEAPMIHHLLVIGDCSKTEFLTENIELANCETLPKDQPAYHYYDIALEEANPKTQFIEPGTIYTFGPTCFHRGSPAQHNGWRYFIRITESNHYDPRNEIRYQTQVYTNGRVSW